MLSNKKYLLKLSDDFTFSLVILEKVVGHNPFWSLYVNVNL